MPLISLDVIKSAFPHLCLGRVSCTFQNKLIQADYAGTPVYIKQYSTLDNYLTEKLVLNELSKLSLTSVRTPKLISWRDDIRCCVISAIHGKPVEKVHSYQELTQLAKLLRDFHRLEIYAQLCQPDLLARLQRYEQNIQESGTLLKQEKDISGSAFHYLRRYSISHSLQSVHGDINVGNILYDASSSDPYALIDFE